MLTQLAAGDAVKTSKTLNKGHVGYLSDQTTGTAMVFLCFCAFEVLSHTIFPDIPPFLQIISELISDNTLHLYYHWYAGAPALIAEDLIVERATGAVVVLLPTALVSPTASMTSAMW